LRRSEAGGVKSAGVEFGITTKEEKMPIAVYSVQVRGRDLHGGHRCASKEEAERLYEELTKAVNSPEEFFEIELGSQKVMARKSNVSGFALSVHMEETPEERRARAVAQMERNFDCGEASPDLAYAQKNAIGGGLIGGY
jgi:hypothetical protein